MGKEQYWTSWAPSKRLLSYNEVKTSRDQTPG